MGKYVGLSAQDIEFRLNNAWNGLVTLKETYKGAAHKYLFEDKDYGEFVGYASHIFKGKGGHPIRCELRAKERHAAGITKKGKKPFTREQVAERLQKIWGDLVTLKGEYNGAQAKSLWHDKEYGDFAARGTHVFRNHGHPKRGHARISERAKHDFTLPAGVSLKPGQAPVCNKQDDFRIFIDAIYGEFESSFLYLQRRDNSLHPKAIEARMNDPKFIDENSRKQTLAWQRITANGKEHPSQSKETRAKRKATNLDKYGTEHPLQSKEVQNTANQAKLAAISATGKTSKEYYRDSMIESMQRTYGVDNISQIPEFRLKAARSSRNLYDVQHWETKEWIPCYGTWEVETVQYFNRNKIKFEKELFTYRFSLNGKPTTYTPDFYLPETDIFVEVKGRLYDTFTPKWEAFKKVYPRSELWDKLELKKRGIL